jgi:NAD(P)-dependent dehydrogenase (short-subunit alcohol dehydrogenase family)
MGKQLANEMALITGGSAGISLGAARYVSEEGAQFFTGRRQSEPDKAVAEIGGNLSASQGDASKRADLDRIYALVKDKAGRIDVLFANAGTYEFGTLGKITEEHFIGSSTPTCAACSSRCRTRYHFCPTVRR